MEQCLLREELEYDTYVGENYWSEDYGINHWKHATDVADLIKRAQQAKNGEWREIVTNLHVAFGVNRFRKSQVALFVLFTFWRLMAGFVAINIGMRIPGIHGKLKQLAELPEQPSLASAA